MNRLVAPSGEFRLRTGGHAPAWFGLVLCAIVVSAVACRQSRLPDALNDAEFWSLIETLSEPAGTFSLSDNFVSNEPRFAENARWLRAPGGVYIGVGPEQNFSYIAQLRPTMAFVIDIRTANRNLHLLYKALFELSSDRADFVSRLFSRPRPGDLGSTASVDEIFVRYEHVLPSAEYYEWNRKLVRERLVTTRGFPLSEVDLESIERAFKAFYTSGPQIDFWGSRAVGADAVRPSYRELMTAKDWMGHHRSFLSSEETFGVVQKLHSRNLIVPLVGDFAGPRTLRATGEYVRHRADVVRVFYGSNVGVYLTNQQTGVFCQNLASLPVASNAWFIESDGVRTMASKLQACAP